MLGEWPAKWDNPVGKYVQVHSIIPSVTGLFDDDDKSKSYKWIEDPRNGSTTATPVEAAPRGRSLVPQKSLGQ